MFTKNQFTKLLTLQDAMNKKVNPDWLTAGNDWTLASMMEAVEAIGHHGWKWWKKENPDIAQLQMELVDIWHFMLSEMIVSADKPTLEEAIDYIFIELEHQTRPRLKIIKFNNEPHILADMTLLELLKLFIGCCTVGMTPIILFQEIMNRTKLTPENLYKQYIGKNVLNFFRQDNGYKDGSYIKIWDGREDNEHLVEILNRLNVDDPELDTSLYVALQSTYLDVITAAGC